MKKWWLCFCLFCPLLGFSQVEFPYSKLLHMTTEQLREAKFKYDEDRNQHVLRKTHGLQVTSNVLSALAGTDADIRPDKRDYQVVIQYGDEGIAYVEVLFYADESYHDLLTFANDKGENLLETNSGKMDKIQFDYDRYSFVLSRELREVKMTTDRTADKSKTIDESYNVYRYVIQTGKSASSPWLTRKALKQEKRDARGKKKSNVSDWM